MPDLPVVPRSFHCFRCGSIHALPSLSLRTPYCVPPLPRASKRWPVVVRLPGVAELIDEYAAGRGSLDLLYVERRLLRDCTMLPEIAEWCDEHLGKWKATFRRSYQRQRHCWMHFACDADELVFRLRWL